MTDKSSATIFDFEFDQIEHYQKYKLMRPYIGKNYQNSKTKILLIAESFYLPNESTLNKDPDIWYKGNQDMLPDNEKSWTDCRALIKCDWSSAGHFIYRELNRTLFEVIGEGFSNVAFMKAFQRPACKEGQSFRYDCTEMDIKYAIETINNVQSIIKPDVVIFVAKYPSDKIGHFVSKSNIAGVYTFVCHPGTGGRYWHKKSYSHGRDKFIKILRENY